METNCEKLLAYKKYRYRLLHCRNLCLHLLSLRVHLIALYGWKCPKQLDAWRKWWKWAAKRVTAVLHSLHSPTLTHLHTYYNKSLVTNTLSRRKGCEFPACGPAPQPPGVAELLPAQLPWVDNSVSNVGLLHAQQSNFLNVF